jgi:hypothetical protein
MQQFIETHTENVSEDNSATSTESLTNVLALGLIIVHAGI